ncbi:MAG: hypothetical protein JNK67_30460 [Alphaproteobacteria bacterium]|nr:hypothetical protein [Alphaproteobacteria bacterium]
MRGTTKPKPKPAPETAAGQDRSTVLTPRERFAAIVAEFVAAGGKTDRVAEALKQAFPSGGWTRESIYAELRNGLASGYVSVDTIRSELGERIRARAGLRSATVISTAYMEQVAAVAARRILAILADLRETAPGRPDDPENIVRIGFASGHTMSRVARALAQLLLTTDLAIPYRLQFHALSSTFDIRKLHEDPNFFLARFDEPAIAAHCETAISFVGLAAPSLIESSDLERFRNGPGMSVATAEAKNLDILVTGASDLDDPRSTMFEFYMKEAAEKERLRALGCAGHLLYLPIGPKGPIDPSDLKFVMPTALNLGQVADLAAGGSRVMLVTGPTRYTTDKETKLGPKKIVATILSQRPSLITDLVIDERTARHVHDSGVLA